MSDATRKHSVRHFRRACKEVFVTFGSFENCSIFCIGFDVHSSEKARHTFQLGAFIQISSRSKYWCVDLNVQYVQCKFCSFITNFDVQDLSSCVQNICCFPRCTASQEFVKRGNETPHLFIAYKRTSSVFCEHSLAVLLCYSGI